MFSAGLDWHQDFKKQPAEKLGMVYKVVSMAPFTRADVLTTTLLYADTADVPDDERLRQRLADS